MVKNSTPVVSGLVSKAIKPLKQKAPPTVEELLGGRRAPELTSERRGGIAAEAVLSNREAAAWEAADEQRLRAETERQAAEDAAWERIQQQRAVEKRIVV